MWYNRGVLFGRKVAKKHRQVKWCSIVMQTPWFLFYNFYRLSRNKFLEVRRKWLPVIIACPTFTLDRTGSVFFRFWLIKPLPFGSLLLGFVFILHTFTTTLLGKPESILTSIHNSWAVLVWHAFTKSKKFSQTSLNLSVVDHRPERKLPDDGDIWLNCAIFFQFL